MKKKLVYISSISAPHQIKLCEALQRHFDAHFWFYESAARTRGSWWQIDMGDHCKVLENVFFRSAGLLEARYFALGLTKQLSELDPDIVMLGGFSIPSNYIAYRWAQRHGKKTIVFTERSRDSLGTLRKRTSIWRILHWLYRKIDMVMVSAEDAATQFSDDFGFGDKVVASRYASDLDLYFHHVPRRSKSAYTYLFANRMTEIYNPAGAIDIFAKILSKYPDSKLVMNAAGELGDACRKQISDLGISHSVEFLTNLTSWSDLHKVYERCDILILPANFSNGNFTILEAMASGMGIVISNRIMGIGRMVQDGVNGFNCAPSTEEFVKRIEQYIDKPELFAKHSEINREAVKPLSTRGTAELYADLIAKKLGSSFIGNDR